MLEHLSASWPVISLALFAVAAGQIGRLGQKLERGETVGGRQILIELTMFPAFGSLTGVLGVEMHWPIWVVLASGITAGWLGFITFRLIARAITFLLHNLARGALGNGTPVDQAPPPPRPPPSPPVS